MCESEERREKREIGVYVGLYWVAYSSLRIVYTINRERKMKILS